jgi:two-component system, NarL family, nitrate/nitrite sensor histidine kinase NarX
VAVPVPVSGRTFRTVRALQVLRDMRWPPSLLLAKMIDRASGRSRRLPGHDLARPLHYSGPMHRAWSLSAKLGAIGCALLLMALASIGLTLWVTWQLEGGGAAVNEAGRMRMQTWRLAQTLPDADPQRIETLMAQFDRSLNLLRTGDPARPLFVPHDQRSQLAFLDVQRDWQQLRDQWTAMPRPVPATSALQAEAFVARIDTFVSAIEQQLSRLTSLLNGVQFTMVALTIVSAVALLYSAYLFIFNPLSRLQSGLARVEEGDLATRVDITTDDEFGSLTAGFNRMAQRLQASYEGLESKVREKTESLEAQHARLSVLYQSAAFVARAATLDELAQGIAQQARLAGGADASAVRWSDESNKRYLMLASDCLPQALIDEEHCMPTGDCFCGQPQGQAATRVIPIRLEGPSVQLGHCARAGYETVISVPVRLQERLVGELNLFYRAPRQLSDDDRALLETIASHLAGAIEGLRAAALQRETAVAEERGFIARELHDSIAQSLAFLKIQLALLRSGLQGGDAALIQQSLRELDAGVHESLSDVRELLVHFRTRTNAEDIAPALKTTLTKFEHQTGLATHLEIEGDGLPLPADVQVQVLHVVQEALSNVRKHAHAREVWVDIQQAPQWRVEVRDDGCGFDATGTGPDETHVGLRIMRERAQHIGATVEVASVPGSGTCVVLKLPQRLGLAA